MLADGVAKSDELCDTQDRHAVYGREYGQYFSLLYLIDGKASYGRLAFSFLIPLLLLRHIKYFLYCFILRPFSGSSEDASRADGSLILAR